MVIKLLSDKKQLYYKLVINPYINPIWLLLLLKIYGVEPPIIEIQKKFIDGLIWNKNWLLVTSFNIILLILMVDNYF